MTVHKTRTHAQGLTSISEQPANSGPGTDERVRPILSRPGETWRIDQAAHHAGKDRKTVISWCRKLGIGRQAGAHSPWEVNRVALEMVMHGDFHALEILRSGRREDPDVAIYFDHVGLPL